MGCIDTLNQDKFPPNMNPSYTVLNPLGSPLPNIPVTIESEPIKELIDSKPKDYKRKKRYNHASFKYIIAN